MLMNNNASLQENLNSIQISAGAANFLLKALNGAQYNIEEINGNRWLVFKKGDFMGGMQGINSFIKSLEFNPNSNMEKAISSAIIKQADRPARNNAEVVYNAYIDATEENKANCTRQVENLGVASLNFAYRGIVQQAMANSFSPVREADVKFMRR
jgi:hypothetical protein